MELMGCTLLVVSLASSSYGTPLIKLQENRPPMGQLYTLNSQFTTADGHVYAVEGQPAPADGQKFYTYSNSQASTADGINNAYTYGSRASALADRQASSTASGQYFVQKSQLPPATAADGQRYVAAATGDDLYFLDDGVQRADSAVNLVEEEEDEFARGKRTIDLEDLDLGELLSTVVDLVGGLIGNSGDIIEAKARLIGPIIETIIQLVSSLVRNNVHVMLDRDCEAASESTGGCLTTARISYQPTDERTAGLDEPKMTAATEIVDNSIDGVDVP